MVDQPTVIVGHDELGPLVRRWGIKWADIPYSVNTNLEGDELDSVRYIIPRTFIERILREAVPFIDSAVPAHRDPLPAYASRSPPKPGPLWQEKGTKSSKYSHAPIRLLQRTVSAKELQVVLDKLHTPNENENEKATKKMEKETWVARWSTHRDAVWNGTAKWEEFRACIRDNHANSEASFTPTIVDTREAISFFCEDLEVEAGGYTWINFSLVVQETQHKMPSRFLKDRTFPVLRMTCSIKFQESSLHPEFLVVSIPVPDFGSSGLAVLCKMPTQIGSYVSIERLRVLPEQRIEWLLATASDASGRIPLWVQDYFLKDIVWKDVPLFLRWVAKGRMSRELRARGERLAKDVGAVAPAAAAAAAAAATAAELGRKASEAAEKTMEAGAGPAAFAESAAAAAAAADAKAVADAAAHIEAAAVAADAKERQRVLLDNFLNGRSSAPVASIPVEAADAASADAAAAAVAPAEEQEVVTGAAPNPEPDSPKEENHVSVRA